MRLALILVLCFSALFTIRSHAQSGELSIKPIQKNIYQYVSYASVEGYGLVPANGLVVVKNGQGLLIDTPWTDADTKGLLNWFADREIDIVARAC